LGVFVKLIGYFHRNRFITTAKLKLARAGNSDARKNAFSILTAGHFSAPSLYGRELIS
jgi:hypothetical protein